MLLVKAQTLRKRLCCWPNRRPRSFILSISKLSIRAMCYLHIKSTPVLFRTVIYIMKVNLFGIYLHRPYARSITSQFPEGECGKMVHKPVIGRLIINASVIACGPLICRRNRLFASA